MGNRRSDISLKAPVGHSNRLGRESPIAMGARRRTYGAGLRRMPSGPSTFPDDLNALASRLDNFARRFDKLTS
jgi:hypothetical protein